MAPKRGQAPFLQELSTLEVETLEIVENAPESEQKQSLDSIAVALGNFEADALLTGTIPSNDSKCCCCCGCACCCPCC